VPLILVIGKWSINESCVDYIRFCVECACSCGDEDVSNNASYLQTLRAGFESEFYLLKHVEG